MAKSKKDGSQPLIIVKRVEEEGHGGAHGGSWKVAYADFVTAMMALFLLLWLLAALKPQQKEAISNVFQDKAPPSKEKVIPTTAPTFLSKDAVTGRPELPPESKMAYEVALRIKELLAADPNIKANAGVSADEYGVLLNVNNAVMFKPNSAELTPEARQVLDGVVAILQDHNIDLAVRGHADDKETGGTLYPSKWELSSARSAAAIRYITEKGGIPGARLTAEGFGDSRPLVPPTAPDSLNKNRRVEFYYHQPMEHPTRRQ